MKQDSEFPEVNEQLNLNLNHRGRPFKGNESYTVVPGYPEIQINIVDYFDRFGISGGLVFQDNQDFYRKTMIQTEFKYEIKDMLKKLKQKTETVHQLQVDDIAVFLNAIANSVDNMCVSQLCQFLLTIFQSIQEDQDVVEDLKKQFLQKSYFFSLKFKQLKGRKQPSEQYKSLTKQMVKRIKNKISKNTRNKNKKNKNIQKKKKNRIQKQQQQSSDQVVTLKEDKEVVKQQFDILFQNVRKQIMDFVNNIAQRQKYLAQQRIMNQQLLKIISQKRIN